MSDELDDREWAILIREALDEPGTVPVQVLEAARAAFTWRTIDADLAEITFDSRAGDVSVASVRSARQATLHALTFTSSSFTIELELQAGELLGQLIPPPAPGSSLTVNVMGVPRSVQLDFDELGCFTFSPLPTRPFRLELSGPASVATEWITL